MPEFLFHVPLPVAGCLIIGSLCAYSLIGLMLARRFVIPRLKVSHDDSDFTGAMVQAIIVGLVVMLIVAFDRPFLGDLGIDPSPYQLVREQLITP